MRCGVLSTAGRSVVRAGPGHAGRFVVPRSEACARGRRLVGRALLNDGEVGKVIRECAAACIDSRRKAAGLTSYKDGPFPEVATHRSSGRRQE